MKGESMAKTVFAAGVCIAGLIFAVFTVVNAGYCQEEREEEEEDLFDRAISVEFKKTAADEAAKKLARITGISIIIQAETEQRLAKAGIHVSLSLKHVPAYDAIGVFAEYLNLDCQFRNRMVILKEKPTINHDTVVGTLTIHDGNLHLSLKIFQGEIPPELKRDLIRGAIEQKIMHQNAVRERIEREMERKEEILELDDMINKRFIERDEERAEDDEEKDNNADHEKGKGDEKTKHTDKRKKEIF